MDIFLDKKSDRPLYVQLYEIIKNKIDRGDYKEDRLPSIRKLANSAGVNNVTVINAYKLLEERGYTYSIKGSGTYIKKENPMKDSREDRHLDLMMSGVLPIAYNSIDLASISPEENLFPVEQFKNSIIEVLDRDGPGAFSYSQVGGYPGLRRSISNFILKNYGIKSSPEEILITGGGQQALDILSKSLISPGDFILVEDPCYKASLSYFKNMGAKLVPCPIKDGFDLDDFKEKLIKYKPRFFYMMTNFQNPTTYSYPEDIKKEILSLAREFDFYIIEDDFLTDLYFTEKKYPLKSMDEDNRVIFIKSFSKVFMPGVRLGFISFPQEVFSQGIKAKYIMEFSSSGFLQRAFDLYLRRGHWEEHVENSRRLYFEKYKVLKEGLESLGKYGLSFYDPKGGLSFWVKLGRNLDSYALYERAHSEKLALVPGRVFFLDGKDQPGYIRLSFSKASIADIKEAISILRLILKEDKIHSNYIPFV